MERYDIIEPFHHGAQARVYMVTDKLTHRTLVLKEVPLGEENEIPRFFIREASLLSDLQHPNIVRLERVFIHDGCAYMVLEYMPMDLNIHMGWHEDKYPDIIRKFLKQILSGISFCHSLGVLHRDLKPQNLLIETTTNTLKIADFGLSRGFVTPDLTLSPKVQCAFPHSLSILVHYSTSVDMWSVGCIFAEMVNLEPLFGGESEIDVLLLGTPNEDVWPGVTLLPDFPHAIIQSHPKDLGIVFEKLEPAGLDLLSRLLCLDPEKRITAEDALGHEYLKH
ncbi:cell division control 2 [Actinidia rufa]|uniref:cyclin-dependent kinase n=1 Tax=Actinidia rufa TaxID=165716 RepID=A0A7J0G0C6_9ERIC|nr:cell division control 2 [Actinidia rufa]